MYTIINKRNLNSHYVLLEVEAPRIAEKAMPGQFLLAMNQEHSARVPLGICAVDKDRQSVNIIVDSNCANTSALAARNVGDQLFALVGPLGNACPVVSQADAAEKQRLLLVCSSRGVAPVYAISLWAHQNKIAVDILMGAAQQEDLILAEELSHLASQIYTATSNDYINNIVNNIEKLAAQHNYTHCIATGNIPLKRAVAEETKKINLPTLVCLYAQTYDGSGMSGDGRVTVGGKVLSASIDGSFFDGHAVDFDEQMRQQAQKDTSRYVEPITVEPKEIKITDFVAPEKNARVRPQKQTAETRIHNFDEVNRGFTEEQAKLEASRCLNCKKPMCSIKGCPINNRIPEFIHQIVEGNYEEAYQIIMTRSTLPGECGRVCAQEKQCEGSCVRGMRGEPIAIGLLERFVADWHREHTDPIATTKPASDAKKVAVIGAGPAGMACAHDLAQKGYRVTLFEAMHEAGGVMIYGIPEFVLPKKVVQYDVDKLLRMGVEIETNVVAGKTVTIDDLLDNKGFSAVFVGAGAGLPRFMGIKGETLGGIMSANELLAKVTLLHANKEGFDTPLHIGKHVAVIGGGNTAIDAARVALRLGAEVTIVYRRDEENMPARRGEIQYAKEEGIHFCLQTNPVEFLGDEQGNVNAMRCVRMEMGEPDADGRRSFSVIEGSEFNLPVDNVFLALGSSAIPIVMEGATNVATDRKGLITTDETGRTSRAGVFAGGDIVSGPQTVVQAMGAGRKAAEAIDQYLQTL